MPTALLIGGNPYLAYQPARLLKEAGAKVVLLCDSGGIVRHSKFIGEWIDVHSLVGDTATRVMSLLALRHFDLTVQIDERTAEALLTAPAASMEHQWIGPQAAGAFASRTAFADWAVTRGLPIAPDRTYYSPAEAVSWIEESGSSFLKCNQTTRGAGVSTH